MSATHAVPDTCLMRAWRDHEHELRGWLVRRLPSGEEVDDLLQALFLKLLRPQIRFCDLDNSRAWLFTVARNLLADHLRLRRDYIELPPDLEAVDEAPAPVDLLSACLPRALADLKPAEQDIIQACDLDGLTQSEYARRYGLSLSAAKSRLLRARKRLKTRLVENCRVRLDSDSRQVCCFIRRGPA